MDRDGDTFEARYRLKGMVAGWRVRYAAARRRLDGGRRTSYAVLFKLLLFYRGTKNEGQGREESRNQIAGAHSAQRAAHNRSLWPCMIRILALATHPPIPVVLSSCRPLTSVAPPSLPTTRLVHILSILVYPSTHLATRLA